ncbi:MAG TPA: Ig-like domain-containing protein, partial [Verrucomicrobiae bacterium]|nr:Ig-like domain-containing protein [Verrucomicrobiae bacterium]
MKIKLTLMGAWTAAVFLLPSVQAADPVTLVPAGATWKYLDDGSNQGTAWVAPGYNDTAWKSGPAKLGYGDGDEATVVDFGPDANNKFTTTYFRHAFNVANPSEFMSLRVRVIRDDGAVVYLNGTEVFRSHMPEGPITYQTFSASPAVGGTDETTFFEANIDPGLLASGDNVLAVEIHQVNLTSSDLGFNLELIASADPVINNPPTVSITSPVSNTAYSAPANILIAAEAMDSDGSISLVEFFRGATKLGQSAVSPFSFDWTGVPIGNYQLTAVATDNLGAKTTSDPVAVFVLAASDPVVVNVSPPPGNVSSLTSITVTFSEPVVGVEAANLLVNDQPAVGLTGSGASYTFTFSQPAPGTVLVYWDVDHVITDQGGTPFDETTPSASWSYQLVDLIAPSVARQSPSFGATVTALTQFEVEFSEPVSGVDANDLRIAGQPASSV